MNITITGNTQNNLNGSNNITIQIPAEAETSNKGTRAYSTDEFMNALFTAWSDGHEDSPEYGVACATGKETDIIEGVAAESKLAFTAGFQTAVSLLMGGVQ